MVAKPLLGRALTIETMFYKFKITVLTIYDKKERERERKRII